jgi:hypothetical protein
MGRLGIQTIRPALPPLGFRFYSANQLGDVMAFLDSYAVEVWKEGKVYLRAPVAQCGYNPLCAFGGNLNPQIDWSLDLRLVPYGPPDAGDGQVHNTKNRWPFFVEHPFRIFFAIGDQWWQFHFTPGKTYQERRVNLEDMGWDT